MLTSWMSRFLVSSKFSRTVGTYEAYGLGWVMLLYRLWEDRTGGLKDYCLVLKKWQKPVLREGCPGYRTDLERGACRQGMLKKQQKPLRKGRRSLFMENQAGKGTSHPFYSFFARKAWQKPWCTSVPTIWKYFSSSFCPKNDIKKKLSTQL